MHALIDRMFASDISRIPLKYYTDNDLAW